MLCPSCNSENSRDAAFCEQCGARLEFLCPGCKAAVSHAARFCKKCGAAFPGPAAISAGLAVPEIKAASDGERKTVTALFADLKGSTELVEELDPEEARAIVDPALRIMIDAVRRYDGYVVQSTGH